MIERVAVERGRYHDSALLMRVARQLEALDGVAEAVVLMGTEMNRDLLREAGFDAAPLADAGPLDLVVAVRAADQDALVAAHAALDGLLSGGGGSPGGHPPDERPRTVADALVASGAVPEATVVSISVPGTYAAHAAHRALDAGCHVFLFSDNVPLDQEVALKRRGRELGLLVMGPDCGTSILAGVPLGFANRIPRGAVGLVGPSGTGIQEISCLLAADGLGVSHAIGTGSRDMRADVGGEMTAEAVRLLTEDAETRTIVLVAKSPDAATAERLHAQLAACGKPAVVRYLGRPPQEDRDGVIYASTLDSAAALASRCTRGVHDAAPRDEEAEPPPEFEGVGGRLIGLFGGGSLAAEAREILRRAGIVERRPGRPWLPGGPLPDGGHLLLDTGDDLYTRGRPHPMVDPAVRLGLLEEAIRHPGVGIVLLDLVLGDGSHADPATELARTVARAKDQRGDGHPIVIVSVSGTPDDPQDAERQVEILRHRGLVVRRSAAAAAAFAALMLGGTAEEGGGR